MDFAEILKFFVSSLPFKVPLLIVALGGIVVAAANYSKNPPVNRRVVVGLSLILGGEFLSLFVPLANIYLFKEYGSRSEMGYLVFLISFPLVVAFAVGLGLVLSAVWKNRDPE